jgi:magnesium transporter
MSRLFHRVTKPAAQAPGTVEYTGERKVDRVTIKIIDYAGEQFDEREVTDIAECLAYRETDTVTWININGLHDTDLINDLGRHYDLHPLVLEDIVNYHQRPKLEDFGNTLFLVCRMLRLDPQTTEIHSEQLSLVLGANFLVTFQEVPGDVFEPVRQRLRAGRGRLRRHGPDYLAYALIDAVVDSYFGVAEKFGEQIEAMEETLLAEPTTEALGALHGLKRELVLLRRAVWPMREVVAGLDRLESELMGDHVSPFLRDIHDHVIQVADTIESFRDMLASLQDLYMSNVSNRMNDVMKVLTIFASIFVPLTFVAGIYGMNFSFMPELQWKWSYPIFWGVILAMVMGMLQYFRRKKWL